jgi:pyrimidine-nucleoside phosphorylase
MSVLVRAGAHLRRSWRSASGVASMERAAGAPELQLPPDQLVSASERLRRSRSGGVKVLEHDSEPAAAGNGAALEQSGMSSALRVSSASASSSRSSSSRSMGVSGAPAHELVQQQKRAAKDLSRRRSVQLQLQPASEYSPSEIIVKKRDGHQLSANEIDWFVQGFHTGYVETYQMSAFLMAVCTRGMTMAEATDLTKAMVRSGKINDLSKVRPGHAKVDKHSSGGTGDKVSLILTPLVACFDVVVPMMSGRGLGHTGGTLDKISSIPGLRTNLTNEQYLKQLEDVGCAIVAPPEDSCPVEKKIYRIRDVSGCVEDVGLVASSIMSKKLAERPDALLLDVKMGRGAFAKCLNDAAALASLMVSIGQEAGIDTCCLLTNMNSPLGSAVGNSLEMREALHILKGKHAGPLDPMDGSALALQDVRHLVLSQAAVMLGLGGKARSFAEGYAMAADKLASGDALNKFAHMVAAQGGDPDVVLKTPPPRSSLALVYRAPEDIIVQDIDAFEIGMASTKLGAGRRYANDPIDLHAGIILHAKMGEMVRKGEPIFSVMVGQEQDDELDSKKVGGLSDPQLRLREGFDRALNAIAIAPNKPEFFVNAPPIIEFFVDVDGMKPFKSLQVN